MFYDLFLDSTPINGNYKVKRLYNVQKFDSALQPVGYYYKTIIWDLNITYCLDVKNDRKWLTQLLFLNEPLYYL